MPRMVPALLLLVLTSAPAEARNLAVAWDDGGGAGSVELLQTSPPLDPVGEPIAVAPDGILRAAPHLLVHLSRSTGTVTKIDPERWSALASYALGSEGAPRDLVFVGADRVWVTRAASSSLLEIDLETGATTEGVDLAPYGAGVGGLSMETALSHEGRLYVQLRGALGDPSGSHFLGVIDIESRTLVDVDPGSPGIQAIALEGTAPRFRMQIVPDRRELLVSATGAFQDSGGIELIDLDTLESRGVVVREFVDVAGNDLGVFVMTDADSGWLVFSTDIVLSSHLHAFTLSGGGNTPEAANSLFYFAPAIAFDAGSQTIFWPEPGGVRAFDAGSGLPRPGRAELGGDPTDLVLLPEPDAMTWVALAALACIRRRSLPLSRAGLHSHGDPD